MHYCGLDFIALHKVISAYKDLIYNEFTVNTVIYPTAPSLAFGIFL